MDKGTVIDIVTRFHEGITARGIKPLKIILYGSYATGANRERTATLTLLSSPTISPAKATGERLDVLADVIYEIFAPVEVVALDTG